MEVILLESPLWTMFLLYYVGHPLGITSTFAVLFTGALCGRRFRNISTLKGLAVGALMLVVISYAVHSGLRWIPVLDIHFLLGGIIILFLIMVATVSANYLWSLFAREDTEAKRAARWTR